jgi:hypothetical protein
MAQTLLAMPVPVTLTYHRLDLCEFFPPAEVDWRGNRRPAIERHFVTHATVILNEHQIPLKIMVRAFTKDVPDAVDDEDVRNRISAVIASRAGSEWPTRGRLALVGGETMWAQIMPRSSGPLEDSVRVPIHVTDACATSLLEQWQPLLAANRKHQAAVQLLASIIQDGMHAVQQKARCVEALRDFIGANLRAADLGHLYGWYQEKMPRVRDAIAELIKRKRSGHPEVQRYIDDATRQLYCFRSLDYWDDQPPSSASVDAYLPAEISGAMPTT